MNILGFRLMCAASGLMCFGFAVAAALQIPDVPVYVAPVLGVGVIVLAVFGLIVLSGLFFDPREE